MEGDKSWTNFGEYQSETGTSNFIFEYRDLPLMHSRITSFLHFPFNLRLIECANSIRATRLTTPEVKKKQSKQRIGSEMFFKEGDGAVQLILDGSFGKVQFSGYFIVG